MAVTTIKSFNSDFQAEVTSDNALKVAGNVTANNSSVGPTGDPIPSDATLIAGEDPNGNLSALQLNSNGELKVAGLPVFDTQDVFVGFNEVSGIAVGIETTINTYVAPMGKISYLLSILNSGENRGEFRIYNNGVLFDKQYTNVTQLTASFDYKTGSGSVPGMVIQQGNTITVAAINSGNSSAGYNSRFLILEVTV